MFKEDVHTIFLCLICCLQLSNFIGGLKQILNTASPLACSQPHYYDADSIYIVKAEGEVTGSKCSVIFRETVWNDNPVGQRCYSICIKIANYSTPSCDFKMVYHDGLGDTNAKKFDCHTFPPLLWCSSKSDLKIEFKELPRYKGDGYNLFLEVRPYCSDTTKPILDDEKENSKNWVDRMREEEKRQRDTVIIAGSLVSTVSFMLVIFWVIYCCWKRRNPTPHIPKPKGDSSRATSSTRSHSNKPPEGRHQSDSRHGNSQQQQPWYPVHLQQPHNNQPSSQIQFYPQSEDNWIDARYTKLPELNPQQSRDITFTPQIRYSPTKEVLVHKDSSGSSQKYGRPDMSYGQHSYDADVDLPYYERTTINPPPLPPRPNYQPKQVFI